MVYLYATNVSTLQDPLENSKIMEGLPEERKSKILNCRQKHKRLQSLGAGLLLSKVLKQYKVPMETLRTDSSGKPVVEGICFNLSHSGDIVICAVSEKSVGCDIERVKDAPKQMAKRMFSVEERKCLQQVSGESYNREFFRIWTRKESFLKMTGTGIRGSIAELEFRDCYIKEYTMPEYQIAVCAKEDAFAEMIWEGL